MSQNLLYDPAIRDAIASGKAEKMKAILLKAKKQLKTNPKLLKSTQDLEAAIKKLNK
jgi:hypothetical protein